MGRTQDWSLVWEKTVFGLKIGPFICVTKDRKEKESLEGLLPSSVEISKSYILVIVVFLIIHEIGMQSINFYAVSFKLHL